MASADAARRNRGSTAPRQYFHLEQSYAKGLRFSETKKMMTTILNLTDSPRVQLSVPDNVFCNCGLEFETASNRPAKDIRADNDVPAQAATRKTYAEYYSVGGEGHFIGAGLGPGLEWDFCETIAASALSGDEAVFVLSPGLPAMLLPRELLRRSGP